MIETIPSDGGPVFHCEECGQASPASAEEIPHKPVCLTWLQLRLEPLLVKHPKLKFQITKLTRVSGTNKRRAVYVAQLCAPYVVESGSILTDDYKRTMLDARVPIKMSKSELEDETNRDRIFKERRILATHLLLDFVEAGEVPCRSGGRVIEPIQVTAWGTEEDLYPQSEHVN